MKKLKFKTNIKCNGCINTVAPFMDKAFGIKSWKVDLNDPERILEVEAEGINSDQVIKTLQKAGYLAVAIQD